MIDYAALLAATPGLAVITGNYDFARDGGALGLCQISTEVLPAGAIPLLNVMENTEEVTGGANWTATLLVPEGKLSDVNGPVGVYNFMNHMAGEQFRTVVSRAPAVLIEDDPLTAGVFQFWIVYLPT